MQVITNAYPHNWGYQLNFVDGPFKDLRVRRAANLALNRSDMKELLGGIALEGFATVPPSTSYYGKPVHYNYDPARAKELLDKSLSKGKTPKDVSLTISTSQIFLEDAEEIAKTHGTREYLLSRMAELIAGGEAQLRTE
jgi:ABC-type oligopeptide transport system substrate-binding subunit